MVFSLTPEPCCPQQGDCQGKSTGPDIERSGHGTEFIIEKCEAQGLATPQYKPDSALFHTIIWRKTEKVHQVGGVEAQSWPSQGQVEGTSQGQVVSLFVRITSILADQVLSSGDITTALGKEYYSGHLRRATFLQKIETS